MLCHHWRVWCLHGEPRRCRVAAVLLAAAFITTLLLYWVLVPYLFGLVITKSLELHNDSEAVRLWARRPVSLFTRVYLWNLTNAAEVSTGTEAPALRQVGPYVYEVFTEKFPVQFKNNSIVYNSRNLYKFRQDLTSPASLDDTIVTLNAALYGAASLVEAVAPAMVSVVSSAAPVLFPGLDSVFTAVRVGDYLFEGVTLHCAQAGGTVAALVCGLLPSHAPPTIRKRPDSADFAYSFLAHKNDTFQGPYEEDRGLKDIHQLGHLLRIKGSKQLHVWQAGSVCDQLRGTDSLLFSPFIKQTDILETYIPDVCQPVPLHWEAEAQLRGLHVFKFSVPQTWLSNTTLNPGASCYCSPAPAPAPSQPLCRRNGVRDVSKCMRVPVIMSLPHFLWADEDFRIYARGMEPDGEFHSSYLYIEPQTGTPIKAAKRIQFNMYLRKIEGFNLVQNVSEGLFPLLWIEEVLDLPENVLALVRGPLVVQWVVNTLSLLVAVLLLVALCCVLIVLFYRNWKSTDQGPAIFTKSSRPVDRRPPLPVLTLARNLYPHPS